MEARPRTFQAFLSSIWKIFTWRRTKNAFTDSFCQYHSDAMVYKLSTINNSLKNESFNSTVASKTPKIRYYGDIDNNVGYGYISKILESLGIDPGRNCEGYVCELEKKEKTTAFEKHRCSSRREGMKFEHKEFMGP